MKLNKKNDCYSYIYLLYKMTNFFPINEDTFVDFCMRDIRAIGFESWIDTYHTHIDYHVDNNSDDENIMIINHYAGGIFEAIQLYKSEYGEFTYRNKKHFYALLAFVSIYHKFYDDITEIIKDEENEDEDE